MLRVSGRLLTILLLAGVLLLLNERSFNSHLPENMNIILLTVDSLRPDHLGCYGYGKNTSPHIDALADKGVLFHRAFSQSAWTIPGLMSILTSMQPTVHGVDRRGATLDPEISSIFDYFAKADYKLPNICFILSLPEFSGIRIGPVEEEYFSEQDGDELFRWLDANYQEKFFLWYHYRNVHLPFRPKDPSHSLFLTNNPDEDRYSPGVKAVLSEAATIPVGTVKFEQSDRPIIEDLYDGEVKELDAFVGRMQARLQKLGIANRTLIVLTADHGDELLDHGFVGHASTSHSATLYDEIIRIPLIMNLPDYLPGGIQIHEQVQQIDIMPTLLAVAGIPSAPGAQGRSLAPLIFDPSKRSAASIPVFSETVYGGYQATEEMEKTHLSCVRTDSWKLIETDSPKGKKHELYDLLIDIKEQQDVYKENPEAAAVMQTLLEEIERENLLRRRAIKAERKAIFSDNGEAACPELIFPYDGAILRFGERHGMVRASWTGSPTATYIVEYEIGTGPHHLTGSFLTFGNQRDFGPYSEEIWKAIAVRNPWRVRISPDVEPRCWSEWMQFTFE